MLKTNCGVKVQQILKKKIKIIDQRNARLLSHLLVQIFVFCFLRISFFDLCSNILPLKRAPGAPFPDDDNTQNHTITNWI